MKIKSLELVNIGIIKKIIIDINKPLNLIIGDVEAGKTTILKSIQIGLGAKFPIDILRHGTDIGHIIIKWDNSSIKRVLKRNNKGVIKADKIVFIHNGELQDNPKNAIKEFMNPFLLDQKFFINKSELEKSHYFLTLFDINLTKINKEIVNLEEKNKTLRSNINGYGEIDIVEVRPDDILYLIKERQKIINEYQKDKDIWRDTNKDIKKHNTFIINKKSRLEIILKNRDKLKEKLHELRRENDQIKIWLNENKEKDEMPEISLPDTAKIDEKISDAKVTNERHAQYLKNKLRHDEKQGKKLQLSDQETDLKKMRANKIKKLSSISDSCKVPNLKFNENAEAIYEKYAINMLSHSQLQRLSSELEKLHPVGFGLELIDAGESLGFNFDDLKTVKNVQIYIDKALNKRMTILATVVGEQPSKIPDEVGVFIIKKGELK